MSDAQKGSSLFKATGVDRKPSIKFIGIDPTLTQKSNKGTTVLVELNSFVPFYTDLEFQNLIND